MPGDTTTAAKTFGWLSGSQMEKKLEKGMVAEGENNSQQEG